MEWLGDTVKERLEVESAVVGSTAIVVTDLSNKYQDFRG